MKCNSCGAVVADTFTDCPVCGAKLTANANPTEGGQNWQNSNPTQYSTCMHCGTQMPQGAAFCPNCGASRTANAFVNNAQTSYVNVNPSYPPQQQKDSYDGMAIASMIVSIISMICCGVGLLSGIVGLILGIVGLKSKSKKSFAIVGIVIGALTIVMNIGFIISFLIEDYYSFYFYEDDYIVNLFTR